MAAARARRKGRQQRHRALTSSNRGSSTNTCRAAQDCGDGPGGIADEPHGPRERRRHVPAHLWHRGDDPGALAELREIAGEQPPPGGPRAVRPRQRAWNTRAAAATVASTSASLCAADTNPASKAEGARYTPSSSMPWKKRLKRSTSQVVASA